MKPRKRTAQNYLQHIHTKNVWGRSFCFSCAWAIRESRLRFCIHTCPYVHMLHTHMNCNILFCMYWIYLLESFCILPELTDVHICVVVWIREKQQSIPLLNPAKSTCRYIVIVTLYDLTLLASAAMRKVRFSTATAKDRRSDFFSFFVPFAWTASSSFWRTHKVRNGTEKHSHAAPCTYEIVTWPYSIYQHAAAVVVSKHATQSSVYCT